MSEVLAWAIKLSKIFNDDIGRGVRQVDLSQQYGYDKSSVSSIVHIYPRLKETEVSYVKLSNRDLLQLARVECDAFRYALAAVIMPAADVPVSSPLSVHIA